MAPEDTRPLTLDDIHRLHPWPARYGDGKKLEYLWIFDLKAPVDAVWRITADTSRLNRALGTAEMHFAEKDGQVRGWSKNGGVRHEWLEVPWNWVAGEWLESVRVYDRGFMKVMHGVQRVAPLPGGGTRFTAYFGFLPRNALGAAAIKLGFPGLEKAYRKVLAEVDQQLAGAATVPAALVAAPPVLSPDARARLETISSDLIAQGLDRGAVEQLVGWVRTADDADLGRIQVGERARAWSIPEDTLLRVCLHATRAGLLDLSWDVVCPHCRGSEGHGRLGALPGDAACDTCAITFGTDRDNVVEITFRVHRSIREVQTRSFCSAEPAHKSHVRVQRALPPGASVEVAPALEPRRYRMRLHGEERYGYLDVGNEGEAEVEWSASASFDSLRSLRTNGAGNGAKVVLTNDRDEETRFVLEEAQWSDVALRPGRLLSFQEFRDLFSEEYLGADVQLAIGEQTILFTDMVGSTALYASRGDPAAFVEVRKHFADVFGLIAEHRGAVVKTIGDAAMGAFNDPLDAVRCSRAIHDRFPPGCTHSVARLRISLNTGPCIAVKLNANIDYFGGTVNVAAKLQALAESWQIAMAQATYHAPGVAAYLAQQGAELEDLVYRNKALTDEVKVKRWTVYRE
jgi:class 3 adenylate cyclase